LTYPPDITAAAAAAGDESRKKLGAYLMQAQFQASVHSSNFVMTAAAQNLLCLQMAASVGVSLDDPFMTWLAGSSVPVLLGACSVVMF
jgi:DASS family divalent anion:Na+ symporter